MKKTLLGIVFAAATLPLTFAQATPPATPAATPAAQPGTPATSKKVKAKKTHVKKSKATSTTPAGTSK